MEVIYLLTTLSCNRLSAVALIVLSVFVFVFNLQCHFFSCGNGKRLGLVLA